MYKHLNKRFCYKNFAKKYLETYRSLFQKGKQKVFMLKMLNLQYQTVCFLYYRGHGSRKFLWIQAWTYMILSVRNRSYMIYSNPNRIYLICMIS